MRVEGVVTSSDGDTGMRWQDCVHMVGCLIQAHGTGRGKRDKRFLVCRIGSARECAPSGGAFWRQASQAISYAYVAGADGLLRLEHTAQFTGVGMHMNEPLSRSRTFNHAVALCGGLSQPSANRQDQICITYLLTQ